MPRATWVAGAGRAEGNDILAPFDPFAPGQFQHLHLVQLRNSRKVEAVEAFDGRALRSLDATAFYDFPAEHWEHLRTSNPIESVFATVRHRTVRTKGALSQKTAKLMVFTLVRAASKKSRKLNGTNQLPRVIEGVRFTNGVVADDANCYGRTGSSLRLAR